MAPPKSLPVKELALHLTDSNRPLSNTELTQLSDLNTEELATLRETWGNITPEWRRQIAGRLLELAEDNLELNFDAIFRSLLTDEDAEVRSTAVSGLWENEDASLITPLIRMVEQDSSFRVRAAATLALGKFAVLAECGKLRPVYAERLCKTLLPIIRDEKRPAEVRRRTLEAVAPLSLPEVREIITTAYKGEDKKLKISAIYAMGRNCDTRWLPYLIKELASTDAETRYEAASALGELEEAEAVPHLARLLADHDSDVQMAAIRALGQIGGTLAKNYLKHCLTSHSAAIRQMAEEALEELDSEEDPLDFQSQPFDIL